MENITAINCSVFRNYNYQTVLNIEEEWKTIRSKNCLLIAEQGKFNFGFAREAWCADLFNIINYTEAGAVIKGSYRGIERQFINGEDALVEYYLQASGGICTSIRFHSKVINCYNFLTLENWYGNGGIVGDCRAPLVHCNNYGDIFAFHSVPKSWGPKDGKNEAGYYRLNYWIDFNATHGGIIGNYYFDADTKDCINYGNLYLSKAALTNSTKGLNEGKNYGKVIQLSDDIKTIEEARGENR